MGAVAREELVEWLVGRERLPADQAEALARIADGLPGRAIGFARQPDLVEWRRRTQGELLDLLGRGTADRFGTVRDLLDQAPRPDPAALPEESPAADEPGARPAGAAAAQRSAALAVVDAWQALTRDLLVAGAGRPGIAPGAHLLPGLEDAAAGLQPPALLSFLALLERTRDGLLQNAAPRLALEAAMLAWPRT
jgi:hypothetical protein